MLWFDVLHGARERKKAERKYKRFKGRCEDTEWFSHCFLPMLICLVFFVGDHGQHSSDVPLLDCGKIEHSPSRTTRYVVGGSSRKGHFFSRERCC